MNDENLMGTMPVPRLIIKTSIPLIISLLVNNLYNLVDSIYVSHLCEDALTGISLAAPLQMIMIALGCGLAVGLNAAVSKALGEKNYNEVKETTSAAIVMAFGAYLLNVIICLLVVKPYFAWQAGGNEAIAQYGTSYIRICMLFSFGQMIQWVFDRLLIATGKSTLFLATLGTASIVNVILDPILIFGYLGFPAMGTGGAAIATVTGQLAGGLLGICLNIKQNHEIPVHFTIRISQKHVMNILKVGIPTAIMQGIMSVMGILINTILYQFSSTAVAIYGILLKVQNLAQIGVQGMNNGLIPILAYNYGAKKEARIYETIRWAFLYAVIVMTVILIILELLPDKILMLFDASDKMMQMGIPAVRIISVSYFVSSVSIIFAAVFQGFGNGTYSMYLTFMRQVILLIPILLIGAFMGSLTVIWFGFIIAEVLSVPFGIWLYGKIKRNTIAPMGEKHPPAGEKGENMSKKVLVVATSPRVGGNSEKLADEFIKGAAEAGHDAQKICLYNKKFEFCRGCLACQNTGECVLHDDVEEILAQMKMADVLIFATPIYFYEMSGQMKTLLDRTNPLFPAEYTFRDIYLLAASADGEESSMDGALKGLEGWISCFEQARLAGVVRGVGADKKGQIEECREVLSAAYEMGRNV